MSLRLGRIASTALTAIGIGTIWLGCSGDKATELVPGMMTQIQVPLNLKSIRVDWQAQGQQTQCLVRNVDPNTGGAELPRTLGVVSGDSKRLVTITVYGYPVAEDDLAAPRSLSDCAVSPSADEKNGVRILRRSRLGYIDGRILFLPMPLRYSCWDQTTCGEGETCQAGRCVPADIDVNQLSEYSPSLIDGLSNTCFSPSFCLADQLAAKVVDEATCKYSYPLPPPGQGMNVKVFYDHAEAEILDLDPNEGFFFPNPADKTIIQLAPGLCDMTKTPKPATVKRSINAINVATACPPKGVLQPLCSGEKSGGPNLPDGGTSTNGTCNIGVKLTSAPSALYILMDTSKSMDPLYGEQGLKRVLDFSLSDPVFQNTAIAFKLIGHQAECTEAGPDTSYSKPDGLDNRSVPFKSAKEAQLSIAPIIGNKGNVDPTDPPTAMHIDAVLQANGAYRAVENYQTQVGSNVVFNRRAVLLFTNRAPADDCPAPHTSAADEALNALNNSNINTYVVFLSKEGGADNSATAAAIATNGGTDFSVTDISTSTGEDAIVKGGLAFNRVVADLSSCLYEKPADLTTGWSVIYSNPLDPTRKTTTKVAYNAACSEATQTTADGWSIDKGRVRICGKACNDFRDLLTAVAIDSAQRQVVSPDVPVLGVPPCPINQ